jgi:hypothetical protein
MSFVYIFMAIKFPGQQQTPNPAHFSTRNVETLYNSRKGQQTARNAYGCEGLVGRKKRMRRGNSVDTGLNLTRPDRELTSDWSFFARYFGELFK